ncbi:MFS transporter [Agrococcus jejuensis]|uniref:MFS transporter, DHA2 family, multidrug resistance protein n=1 Tax=Agrococcus jejuensis TaxID=399736 RepID=A0A1G8FTU3_9MICO|nr:MFS transporter [Agrococcus jejuensis]SDH85563.1 MFS transporter, DHA2 family, multidrug resistance protein [Agrococcus jejuensis]
MAMSTIQTQTSRAGVREWIALAVLMLPVLLVAIDNTVLAFALPEIAGALEPTGAQQLWIVDVYPLVLAGLLVPMGVLGDRFGRRRLLLIGAVGFGVVSVLCAFAPTAELLIAGRALQGLFGATLMPSTMSLLRSLFVDRVQRRLAIAIWATGFSVGSAVGPAVGGLLLAHFWWGSIFLLAIPLLLPMLVLVPLLVRESRDPKAPKVDLVGIVLAMLTLTPLAAAVKHVATDGVDAVAIGLAALATASGVLFVRRMQRVEHPMLDLALLRDRAFSTGVLVNLLSVVALVGFLFFLTQHLQLVVGMSTLEAALVLLPGTAAMIVAGLGSVRLVRRIRQEVVMVGALVASTIAYVTVAVLGADISVAAIAAAFALLGAGIGAAETLSNDLVLASAPVDKAGAAAGVSETAYELGAVLGTAVLGGILTSVYQSTLVVPSGIAADDAARAGETLSGALHVSDAVGGEAGLALAEAARHAFDAGVVWTAGAGAVLIASAAVLTWWRLVRGRSGGPTTAAVAIAAAER